MQGLFNNPTRPKIIMINPAGDAKHTGRKLTNNYERAIAMKLADSLAKAVENRYGMKVLITRAPGDELIHLQNASFANRVNVDFFININIYKEDHEKPRLYLFHRMLDPLADLARRTYPLLELASVNTAHMRNIHKTKSFGERIKMVMTQQDYQNLFDFSGVHGLPIKPLEGIVAPAVLFDIGLNDEERWPMFVEPITASLKFLLDY
jgi:hypothetical protein